MAHIRRFGLARAGLSEFDRPTPDVLDAFGRGNGGAPAPPIKRWRLLVMDGAASAFVRESPPDQQRMTPASPRSKPSEHAASPAKPARSSTQARR
jgi:hypothetical protein